METKHTSPQTVEYSIAAFHKLLKVLAALVSNKGYDAVYGIPRGGLIPAVWISHKLDIPLISDWVDIANYSAPLLVDDILETGNAYQEVCSRISGTPDLAVLVRKTGYKSAVLLPQDQIVWAELETKKRWIKFPYEQ